MAAPRLALSVVVLMLAVIALTEGKARFNDLTFTLCDEYQFEININIKFKVYLTIKFFF